MLEKGETNGPEAIFLAKPHTRGRLALPPPP